MELPAGFAPEGCHGNKRQFVAKLNKSLYGLKQGSYNWFQKLRKGLIDRDFHASNIDPCLYMKKGLLVLTYVDDCIIIGRSMDEIDSFIYSMSHGKENFVLTDKGTIDKFLGIEITDRGEGEFALTQPHLIDRIVKLLDLDVLGDQLHKTVYSWVMLISR